MYRHVLQQQQQQVYSVLPFCTGVTDYHVLPCSAMYYHILQCIAMYYDV